MLLSITLIAVLLVSSYLVIFPKSKGNLRPIKIPVEDKKRIK